MSNPLQSGIINHALKSKEELYRSYIPFMKNGGLFIPTDRRIVMGQELFVLVTLPEEKDRHPVPGIVAWWNPSSMDMRPKGVGLHFISNPATEALRNRIEILLAGYPSDRPTYTM